MAFVLGFWLHVLIIFLQTEIKETFFGCIIPRFFGRLVQVHYFHAMTRYMNRKTEKVIS